MITSPLRTVLIGFGKVAAGFIKDPLLTKHYKYATHAQTLKDHPLFQWEAVVDSSQESLQWAREYWKIPYATTNIQELIKDYDPEVAVLATHPQERFSFIENMPSLKAVVVEKPLGRTYAEANDFLTLCKKRDLHVQVNYWRRADRLFRELAAGKLTVLIGRPQAIFGVYGNGLYNNGSHMIDFSRMLFGEIESIQVIGKALSRPFKSPKNDIHVPFSLQFKDQLTATFHPIDFHHYRENSLEIWGEKAKLAIMQEGLGISLYPLKDNRAIQDEKEIASDTLTTLETTVGDAFYHMYDNLAKSVLSVENLWSPIESALKTEQILETIVTTSQKT